MNARAGGQRGKWVPRKPSRLPKRPASQIPTGGQRPVVEAPEASATLPRPKPVQMHVHPQDASTDSE
jgi:hypothetical protein